MLDFDTLILQLPCTDRPSLRLVVKTTSPTAYPNLEAGGSDGGSRGGNPFAALGIGEVTVENGCQTAGCQNVTAMGSRWTFDSPEVVAFFIPMNYSEAGELIF